MDFYHIVLFLHIVTLLVATGATVVTKVAVRRRLRARTVADALEWHNALISAARFFPLCLAAFVLTGGYMVSVAGRHAWANGYVSAGLVGVVLLLASGTYLGVKGKALKQLLEKLAADAPDGAPPRLAPPPMVAILPMVNTGLALGVVFDMVTKPASIPVALGVIALGGMLGAGIAMRQHPAPAVQRTGMAEAT